MRESFLGSEAIHGNAHRTVAIRTFALALAVLLAVGTFLSAEALGKEVHHRCTGEDCPICQLMAGAARVVGRSATPVPQPPRVPSARLVLSHPTSLVGVVLVVLSPVLLGVRLDI
ncbi:hypothetical protein SAMN05216348_102116 [Olsenella sp. KH3B4]|uniref:hypothetical protein n=1 Tax=Olsenella sp. KH3B4 TaxID=1855394 RepID=UPI0008CE1A84|nr:hypothetical protein [Olsenella sp. KH3B4]SES73044.1 hypothetical protein SAMN05216348_102116 [Olsenella sp. KH3B4]